MKSVGFAIRRYLPVFGDAGYGFQAVVDLYQAVIYGVVHPYRILVTGKRRVQRAEAFIEVDIEDRFF